MQIFKVKKVESRSDIKDFKDLEFIHCENGGKLIHYCGGSLKCLHCGEIVPNLTSKEMSQIMDVAVEGGEVEIKGNGQDDDLKFVSA